MREFGGAYEQTVKRILRMKIKIWELNGMHELIVTRSMAIALEFLTKHVKIGIC